MLGTVAYFASKGIAADRVVAKGYGETAPSAPIDGLKGGKLKAARAKNRRVEFKLLSDLTAAPAAEQAPPPAANFEDDPEYLPSPAYS